MAGEVAPDEEERMFRRRGNRRKTILALGVVLALAAGPAHAGGSGLDWLQGWERLLARWTFGLFGSGGVIATAHGESSSQIDPDGRPTSATTNGESGAMIDPLGGSASSNPTGESGAMIDPNGNP
jgi:hypothetical protein